MAPCPDVFGSSKLRLAPAVFGARCDLAFYTSVPSARGACPVWELARADQVSRKLRRSHAALGTYEGFSDPLNCDNQRFL